MSKDKDTRLHDLLGRFWDGMMKLYPEFALLIGHDDPELNRQLDDYSQEGYAKREIFFREFLQEVEAINVSQISREDRLTVLVLQTSLQKYVNGIVFKQYLMPYTGREGMDYYFIERTIPMIPFSTLQHYEDYCQRIKLFTKQIMDSIENMKIGLKQGIVPFQSTMGDTLHRIKTLMDTKAEDSVIYKPFLAVPDTVSADKIAILSREALKLIDVGVRDAMRDLHSFLQDRYIPSLRTEMSIMSLPNGEARYRAMLRYHTDSDVTPEEVHALGKQTVENLKHKIFQVMEEIGFKGTSIQEFVEYLENQPEHFFQSNEELTDYCSSLVEDQIRPKIAKLFKPYKRIPLEIWVPQNLIACKGLAVYTRPPADGSSPGNICLYPTDLKMYPKYEMVTLMLHEAEPGHHLETCYVYDRCENLPNFRRYKDDRHYYDIPGYLAMNNAHMEGWGLYCESLGEELGLYDDPYDRFGNYAHNILRAARMVVDTGIHALGWSHEDADQYLVENTSLPLSRRKYEIDRYCRIPAQAVSYTWGCHKIIELRTKAEKELGSSFDLKDFHDVCIGFGSMPLNVLETYVDMYIQETKSSMKLSTID